MNFQIPGKTFLVGEYSVLLGGAALGLATRPYFDYQIFEETQLSSEIKLQLTTFHPESPAGLYLKKNGQPQYIIFKDQYQMHGAIGGFGRSTAEYFAAITSDLLVNKKTFFQILNEYKALHQHKLIPPSGMDLAFQFFGQITLADSTHQFYQTLNWNFLNLDFYLISTGMKISTHDHLSQLDINKLADLLPISDAAIKAFQENNEMRFLEAMKNWCKKLVEKSLTHVNSLKMIHHLEKNSEIYLVKPCGALGADVLLVFFDKKNKKSVEQILLNNQYQIQAHSSDLTNGLSAQLRSYWSQNVD